MESGGPRLLRLMADLNGEHSLQTSVGCDALFIDWGLPLSFCRRVFDPFAVRSATLPLQHGHDTIVLYKLQQQQQVSE